MNVNETESGCFMIFFFSFLPQLSFFLFFFSRVNILNCWLARYIMAAMLVAKNQLARNRSFSFHWKSSCFWKSLQNFWVATLVKKQRKNIMLSQNDGHWKSANEKVRFYLSVVCPLKSFLSLARKKWDFLDFLSSGWGNPFSRDRSGWWL